MKQTKESCKNSCKYKGFTLIELLIVVLIIGILAGIALPKYQEIVDKTRYTQAVTLVDRVIEAQKLYRLTHNVYARSFYDLDIELPIPQRSSDSGGTFYYKWGYCYFANENASSIVCNVLIHSGYKSVYYEETAGGRRVCFVNNDDERGHKVCQHVTGKTKGQKDAVYTFYYY